MTLAPGVAVPTTWTVGPTTTPSWFGSDADESAAVNGTAAADGETAATEADTPAPAGAPGTDRTTRDSNASRPGRWRVLRERLRDSDMVAPCLVETEGLLTA